MSSDPAAAAAAQTKPFAQLLQEQRKGVLHTELSEQLQELVTAVVEHDKAGTLTIQLTVAPGPEEGTVRVLDKATLKAPEAEKKPSVFWPDEQGNLSRRDPRQPELPLRGVAGGRDDDNAEEATTA